MKWGDVQLLTDVNGAEYLEYSERQRKEPEPNLGMSEQLNLKLTVSQTVHRTEIQCLFTKFIVRKDLARGRIAIHRFILVLERFSLDCRK